MERLENPELWRTYSSKREMMFDTLALQGNACSRLESLPGSRGPVNTTANIPDKSPLSREIYHQVISLIKLCVAVPSPPPSIAFLSSLPYDMAPLFY